ncbi:hypothetical protein CDD83_9466 [Cordyceps sp. RAO-2017]|nr:hypothetical protein CDD83_9466 [Cordyceps sp. RAO-2017]
MQPRTALLVGLALFFSSPGCYGAREDTTYGDEKDPAKVMHRLSSEYTRDILASLPDGQCNRDNIAVRKEWNALDKEERLDYLRAVKCLQEQPTRGDGRLAYNRYEDFLLTHINHTFTIHFSGLLLPWHRYFVYLYEKALREECGYGGYQPYWDWSLYAANPKESTIFDGSEYSLSGNGDYVPHGTVNVTLPGGPPPIQIITRPPGTGGGCVEDGPFAGMQVHLDCNNEGASTPAYITSRPRCLTRDFLLSTLRNRNSYQNVTDLILKSPDIDVFYPSVDSSTGIHGGGHAFIGGENLNQFVSPNDPAFYFHHAMLDRVWAIWQSRDTETRQYALNGTLTWGNYPPSPKATIEDFMEVDDLAHNEKIKEVMSTTAGLLCYVYE